VGVKVRPNRNWVTVEISRIERTISGGKASVNPTGVDSLRCFLESAVPRNLSMPQGWIERATYVMTWIADIVKTGDIVTYRDSRHVVKTIRFDVQGKYYTAILEAEAK
jgi:hypothetical protein